MPLLIAALMALSAMLIVLYPLLGLNREAAAQAAPGQVADAAERERQARQALREVEFDYTLGNLESDDYEELRGRYEGRALAALKTRYQREQELDALIERHLDALRQSEATDAAPASAKSAVTSTKTTPAKSAAAKPSAPTQRPSSAGGSSVRARRAPKRKGA